MIILLFMYVDLLSYIDLITHVADMNNYYALTENGGVNDTKLLCDYTPDMCGFKLYSV